MADIDPCITTAPDILSAVVVRPAHPMPIVIVGAGGIVQHAHLPAYRKAGYPVAAIIDSDLSKATQLSKTFEIPIVANSVASALAQLGRSDGLVFDIAVPAKASLQVLSTIPQGSAVLLQKPMGETLAEAEAIVELCRSRQMQAAVNFQLRWNPAMLAARELYRRGAIGTLHDIEIQVSTYTPWDLWTFLSKAPRLEILYHSIHYVDLVRSWLGNPLGVYAKTVRNPQTPNLAATKSVIVLDYGEWTRAVISTNHGQNIAPDAQRSFVQWEGTGGLMHSQMGLNLDYPTGKPDYLRYSRRGTTEPETIPLDGNWFPEAFIGSMGSLQRFVTGETTELPTSVEDALDTMRTVEAAYLSSERGGVPLS